MICQAADGTVEFRFYRPDVESVAIVGDFNQWRKDRTAMRSAGDGWWSCCLQLLPGTYQFQYFSEGQYFLDYAAFGLEHGPYGLNSVVQVDTAPVASSAPGTQAKALDTEEVHLRLIPARRRAAGAKRVSPSVSKPREPVAVSA